MHFFVLFHDFLHPGEGQLLQAEIRGRGVNLADSGGLGGPELFDKVFYS